jgi:hypothetical protein
MFLIPFAFAELPVHPAPQDFCEKASRQGYACDPSIAQKIRVQSEKNLKRLPFSNPKAVEEGLALFLADRLKRGSAPSSSNLDGLISPEMVYRPAPFHQVRKDEAQLVQKTQLKSFFKAKELKAQPVNFQGPQGASGAVEKVRDNQTGESGFFKRDKSIDAKLALKRVHAEVAAYQLSELLGLGVVPKTELRSFKGKLGSFQKEVEPSFVPLHEKDHQTLLKQDLMKPHVEDLKLFSYLGSIKDRHTQNLFVDPKSGQLRSVDHETAFHFVLPTPVREDKRFIEHGVLPQQYSEKMKARLKNLKYEEVEQTFKSTLSKEQREALWLRIHTVRADILQQEP